MLVTRSREASEGCRERSKADRKREENTGQRRVQRDGCRRPSAERWPPFSARFRATRSNTARLGQSPWLSAIRLLPHRNGDVLCQWEALAVLDRNPGEASAAKFCPHLLRVQWQQATQADSEHLGRSGRDDGQREPNASWYCMCWSLVLSIDSPSWLRRHPHRANVQLCLRMPEGKRQRLAL